MGAFDRLKENLQNKRGKKYLSKDAFTSKDLTDSAQLIATMGGSPITRTGFLQTINTKGVMKTMDDSTTALKACVDSLYSALEATIVSDADAISRSIASLQDNGTTTKSGANINGAIFVTIATDLRSMYMDTSIAYRNFDSDLKLAKATSDRFSLLKASGGKGRAQTKSVKDLNEIVEKISLLGDKVTFEQVFKPYDDYRASALYQAGKELQGISGPAGGAVNEQALAHTLFAMHAIVFSLEHMIKTVELATLLDTPRARSQEGFLISKLINIYDEVRASLKPMVQKSLANAPYDAPLPGSTEANIRDDLVMANAVFNALRPPTTLQELKDGITRLKDIINKAAERHPQGMQYGGNSPANAQDTLVQIDTDHNLVASTIKPPWKFTP
jgi:hypothetical protein